MARKLGIFPTMLAAYTKDGALDLGGLESLVEWYWKKGCDGIFAACHSSEIRFLSTAAFLEVLAYPATAKYYLRKYEGVAIEPYSRVIDHKLVTPYQKECLAHMKELADFIKERFGITP